MPCTRTGSLDGDHILSLEEDLESVQAEALSLTQMLCAVCRRCEERGVPIPKSAAAWWRKHKAQDDRS
jgi:hypothetical protein